MRDAEIGACGRRGKTSFSRGFPGEANFPKLEQENLDGTLGNNLTRGEEPVLTTIKS